MNGKNKENGFDSVVPIQYRRQVERGIVLLCCAFAFKSQENDLSDLSLPSSIFFFVSCARGTASGSLISNSLALVSSLCR